MARQGKKWEDRERKGECTAFSRAVKRFEECWALAPVDKGQVQSPVRGRIGVPLWHSRHLRSHGIQSCVFDVPLVVIRIANAMIDIAAFPNLAIQPQFLLDPI